MQSVRKVSNNKINSKRLLLSFTIILIAIVVIVSFYTPSKIKLSNEGSGGKPPCQDNDEDGWAASCEDCDPGELKCGDCNDGSDYVNPDSTEYLDLMPDQFAGSGPAHIFNIGEKVPDDTKEAFNQYFRELIKSRPGKIEDWVMPGEIIHTLEGCSNDEDENCNHLGYNYELSEDPNYSYDLKENIDCRDSTCEGKLISQVDNVLLSTVPINSNFTLLQDQFYVKKIGPQSKMFCCNGEGVDVLSGSDIKVKLDGSCAEEVIIQNCGGCSTGEKDDPFTCRGPLAYCNKGTCSSYTAACLIDPNIDSWCGSRPTPIDQCAYDKSTKNYAKYCSINPPITRDPSIQQCLAGASAGLTTGTYTGAEAISQAKSFISDAGLIYAQDNWGPNIGLAFEEIANSLRLQAIKLGIINPDDPNSPGTVNVAYGLNSYQSPSGQNILRLCGMTVPKANFLIPFDSLNFDAALNDKGKLTLSATAVILEKRDAKGNGYTVGASYNYCPVPNPGRTGYQTDLQVFIKGNF